MLNLFIVLKSVVVVHGYHAALDLLLIPARTSNELLCLSSHESILRFGIQSADLILAKPPRVNRYVIELIIHNGLLSSRKCNHLLNLISIRS